MIVKSETRTLVGTGMYSYRFDGKQYILYKELASGPKPVGYHRTFNGLLTAIGLGKEIPRRKKDRRVLTGRNQCETLLAHYREGRSITRWDAMVIHGIAELSARNGEINKKLALEGSKDRVVSERIKTKSGKRVCKYYLGREQNDANT